MEAMQNAYVRKVFYYETDKMGIVHHSNYIRWFEEARIDFMRRADLDCRALEERGILMPVVDVYGRFVRSARFDDTVYVCPTLTSFNGVRACFSYAVYLPDDSRPAVIGQSSHCFVDENTRRPLNLKKCAPDFYAKAVGEVKTQEEGRK